MKRKTRRLVASVSQISPPFRRSATRAAAGFGVLPPAVPPPAPPAPPAPPPAPPVVSGLLAWYVSTNDVYTDQAGTVPAVNYQDHVAVWKDQSGNGNHALQTRSPNNQPFYYPGGGPGAIGQWPTVEFCSGAGNKWHDLPVTGLNSQAISAFFITRGGFSWNNLQYFLSNGATFQYQQAVKLIPTLIASGGAAVASTFTMPSVPTFHGFSSGASNVLMYLGSGHQTLGTVNADALTQMYLGSVGISSGQNVISEMMEVLIYNRALADSEVQQLITFYQGKYGLVFSRPNQAVFDGENQTVAQLAGDACPQGMAYPNQMDQPTGANWLMTNWAQSSQTLATCLANRAAHIDPMYNAGTFGKNVLFIWAGGQDIFNGGTPLTDPTPVYNNLKSYGTGAKAVGWKVVVLDLLPSGQAAIGYDATRITYNSLLAADSPTMLSPGVYTGAAYLDRLVKVGEDAIIGQHAAVYNPAYFLPDGIMITQASQIIVAGYTLSALNSL